jgi:chromosome segregation ATPase
MIQKDENDEMSKLDERIETLENRLSGIEKNLDFLKDLLTHIHTQFDEFKEDIKAKKN